MVIQHKKLPTLSCYALILTVFFTNFEVYWSPVLYGIFSGILEGCKFVICKYDAILQNLVSQYWYLLH